MPKGAVLLAFNVSVVEAFDVDREIVLEVNVPVAPFGKPDTLKVTVLPAPTGVRSTNTFDPVLPLLTLIVD